MVQEILCITFVSSIPFMFSLQGDFVFDDSEAIVKNKDISSDSWLQPFFNDFWGTNIRSNLSHKSYRPLTILTYRLNYFLSNKNLTATQFKITNLLCHVACCLLVWRTYSCLWERFKGKYVMSSTLNVPVIATLMFGVHPIHVEAVCGIVGRADLLSALTFLLSFLIYDKSIKTDSYIYLFLSLIIASASMFFKENGITVLGVSCIYDLLCNINKRDNKKKLSDYTCFKNIHINIKCACRIICVVASAIILLYMRWIIMGRNTPEFKPTDNPAAFSDSIITKVATYNYIYFLNFTLLVWPQWLCYDWSMGCVPLINSVLDFRILLPVILYIYAVLFVKFVITNGIHSFPQARLLIMSVVLISLPFLPASNIVYPVGFVIAERILYIPSIGYCFLIAIGANKIVRKINRKVVICGFYAMILIYLLKSWNRSFDWRSEYDLFTNALNVCPLNAKVHYNVAKVADAKQNNSWALAEYKEAIRLYPEYYQAMNNLANLLKNQNQYTEAELYLKNALHYKQEFPAAWMNLGIVLANTKRYEESDNAYKTALKYRKKYPDCYYNLGNLYLEMNKTNEAIESWHKAINLNPKHVSAWTNLLALLDNTGQTNRALRIIPQALSDVPEMPSINFAIANIYGKIDNYVEAENYFKKAINLFGDRVQAIHFANLGVLYHRWKKYELAEAMYKTALKIDPRFPSAKKNLNTLNKLKNNHYTLFLFVVTSPINTSLS
ncbi:protein O-mannosyl-transferase TMTC4-like [Danaus plexippus]|uniref:protein O-mannosyl-transferase TMTC4-like n=1 Tax=Danaus plexippus TaxID=13037 RepID=UPI002AB24BD7|nr:protein O-mannosyl-transferase TMTC4-like [Danaus plexippus]